jgi:hypothetical protein
MLESPAAARRASGASAVHLLAVTLTLAVLSLGFAPAPFPKADRAAARGGEDRLMRAYLRRLDELGVEWRFEDRGGRPLIRYNVCRAGYGGSIQPGDGNLLGALRSIVENAERSLNA